MRRNELLEKEILVGITAHNLLGSVMDKQTTAQTSLSSLITIGTTTYNYLQDMDTSLSSLISLGTTSNSNLDIVNTHLSGVNAKILDTNAFVEENTAAHNTTQNKLDTLIALGTTANSLLTQIVTNTTP